MNQELLKYLNTIIDKPIKLGETDCNTICLKICDILHNTNLHETYTSNITRTLIRNKRVSEVLEDIGYTKADRITVGSFVVLPEKRWDSVMFVYAPYTVISAFPRMLDKQNKKVRTMKLKHIPEGGVIYS